MLVSINAAEKASAADQAIHSLREQLQREAFE